MVQGLLIAFHIGCISYLWLLLLLQLSGWPASTAVPLGPVALDGQCLALLLPLRRQLGEESHRN